MRMLVDDTSMEDNQLNICYVLLLTLRISSISVVTSRNQSKKMPFFSVYLLFHELHFSFKGKLQGSRSSGIISFLSIR